MWARIPWVASTSLIWTCILSAMRGGSDVPATETFGHVREAARTQTWETGRRPSYLCPYTAAACLLVYRGSLPASTPQQLACLYTAAACLPLPRLSLPASAPRELVALEVLSPSPRSSGCAGRRSDARALHTSAHRPRAAADARPVPPAGEHRRPGPCALLHADRSYDTTSGGWLPTLPAISATLWLATSHPPHLSLPLAMHHPVACH